MNWIDAAIIVVLLLGLLIGYSRGALNIAVGILGYLAGLILAGRLSSYLVQALDWAFGLTRWVAGTMAQRITIPGNMADIPVSQLSTDRIQFALSALPVPEAYKKALLEQMQTLIGRGGADASRTLGDVVFTALAHAVLSAAVFLITLMIFLWLINQLAPLLTRLLDSLPIAGLLNRLLGATIATAVTALTVSVLIGIITPFGSLPSVRPFTEAMAMSTLVPYFTEGYALASRWLFGQVSAFFFVK